MMAAEWPVSTRLRRPRSDEGMTGLGHLRPWAALVVAAPPEGRAALAGSELNLLRDAEGVVDLDAEIADGAFELRMSEERLYGSQVARLPVNLSRLCSAH